MTDILYNTYKQDEIDRPFDTLFRQALGMGCKVRGLYLKYKSRRRAAKHREARGETPYDPAFSVVNQTVPRKTKPRSKQTREHINKRKNTYKLNKRKQKPCKYWTQNKKCRFGEGWQYEHAGADAVQVRSMDRGQSRVV